MNKVSMPTNGIRLTNAEKVILTFVEVMKKECPNGLTSTQIVRSFTKLCKLQKWRPFSPATIRQTVYNLHRYGMLRAEKR